MLFENYLKRIAGPDFLHGKIRGYIISRREIRHFLKKNPSEECQYFASLVRQVKPRYAILSTEKLLNLFNSVKEINVKKAKGDGQVGSNWVHASGLGVEGIRKHCETLSDKYQTPFHMAGYAMVEALRDRNVEKVALNAAYHHPDWWQGTVEFLKEATLASCGQAGA